MRLLSYFRLLKGDRHDVGGGHFFGSACVCHLNLLMSNDTHPIGKTTGDNIPMELETHTHIELGVSDKSKKGACYRLYVYILPIYSVRNNKQLGAVDR
jgi:hypothetical protein